MANKLILIVGATATGKTHWIDILINQILHGNIAQIRTSTDRPCRPDHPDADRDHRIISTEKFEQEIKDGMFFEHDKIAGYYKGSSLVDFQSVLSRSHGIKAISPAGAVAVYKGLPDVTEIFLFKPDHPNVLLANYERRGITDPREQWRLLQESLKFVLPADIPHTEVIITGDSHKDKVAIVDAIVCRLLKK